MYLRILAIVAFFNWALAEQLAPWLLGLSASGLVICALQYRFASRPPEKAEATGLRATGGNPLELGPAMLFSALFVAVSLVSNWAKAEFGTSGIYTLAAIVGVTDIDPFVLNLAQGGTSGLSNSAIAAAILIAAFIQQYSQSALCRGLRRRPQHDHRCGGAGGTCGGRRDHSADDRPWKQQKCRPPTAALRNQRMPWSL
jgi:uncharacterized membrane protein (DUF4010 family)